MSICWLDYKWLVVPVVAWSMRVVAGGVMVAGGSKLMIEAVFVLVLVLVGVLLCCCVVALTTDDQHNTRFIYESLIFPKISLSPPPSSVTLSSFWGSCWYYCTVIFYDDVMIIIYSINLFVVHLLFTRNFLSYPFLQPTMDVRRGIESHQQSLLLLFIKNKDISYLPVPTCTLLLLSSFSHWQIWICTSLEAF